MCVTSVNYAIPQWTRRQEESGPHNGRGGSITGIGYQILITVLRLSIVGRRMLVDVLKWCVVGGTILGLVLGLV